MHFLPQQPVGWWSLALLLAAGLLAAGWGVVENYLHNNWVQVATALVLGTSSLSTAVVAIFKRNELSILLWLVFALVVLEVSVGLLFGMALLLGG